MVQQVALRSSPPLIVHNDDGSYTAGTRRDLLWIT